jgi:hypothetical protein
VGATALKMVKVNVEISHNPLYHSEQHISLQWYILQHAAVQKVDEETISHHFDSPKLGVCEFVQFMFKIRQI